MRRTATLLLLVILFAFVIPVDAQPQLARDHVRGPGGRVVLTVEPDVYPPTAPSYCSASQAGPCPIDGIDVSWGGASDIGSGVSGYNGPGGFTTGFSYHDSYTPYGDCYTYYVTAVDNAGHEGDAAVSNTVCPDICFEGLYAGVFFPNRGNARPAFFHGIHFLAKNGEVFWGSGIKRRRTPRINLVDLSALGRRAQPARATLVAAGGAL